MVRRVTRRARGRGKERRNKGGEKVVVVRECVLIGRAKRLRKKRKCCRTCLIMSLYILHPMTYDLRPTIYLDLFASSLVHIMSYTLSLV